jgi:hypothetical protein
MGVLLLIGSLVRRTIFSWMRFTSSSKRLSFLLFSPFVPRTNFLSGRERVHGLAPGLMGYCGHDEYGALFILAAKR